MNNGKMHLFEQTHIHYKKIRSTMCESKSVPEVQQVQFSEPGHCDPMDICPLGEAGKLRSNQPTGHSANDSRSSPHHTHHFTRISPGSWRACWSSWSSETLSRKHLQLSNKYSRTMPYCSFNETLIFYTIV